MMDRQKLEGIAKRYLRNLLEDVVPFWMKHSLDREHGGYLHHLDRDGSVYDDRKMMWMQGREVWTFSTLCEMVEQNDEWLDAARLGAEFLRDKCRDEGGSFYFLVARDGTPLVAPYNWASEAFAIIGWAAYSRVSGEKWAAEEAAKTFDLFLARRDNPKGRWNKAMPGAPRLISAGVPMILLGMTGELRGIVPDAKLDSIAGECLETLTGKLIDHKRGWMYEYANADGSRPAGPDGRHVNPGHAIEMSWFVLDEVRRRREAGGYPAAECDRLVETALMVFRHHLEAGWDDEHGGIYYFLDIERKPHLALEWNMKLWWPHNEALVALMLAAEMTGQAWCDGWFNRVDEYTWKHFPDPDYGEWFGYLDRRGERTHDLKGGRWKGFFHIPRMLLYVADSAARRAEK